MAFLGMLNHSCDIYHLKKESGSPGYGLPASPYYQSDLYPDVPDVSGVRCHFGVRSGTRAIVQLEPQVEFQASIKLTLPLDTDIRRGDKIVDCDTKYEYTAEVPVKVRDHHITVQLRRTGQQRGL